MEALGTWYHSFCLSFLFLPIIVQCAIPELTSVVRSDECPVLLDPPPITRSIIHQNKIVNGDQGYVDLKYYIGVLDSPNHRAPGLCTCFVLASKVMMSVGECAGYSAGPLFITIGDTYGAAGEKIAVKEQIIHPDYIIDINPEFSLGILILEEEISTAKQYHMKVLIDAEIPRENEPVRIAGRGHIQSNVYNRERLIYQIDIPVLSKEKCEELYDPINTTSRFCAGYGDKKCDICHFDEGSPVFQYDKRGNPVLVGIVVRSPGTLHSAGTHPHCGLQSFPYPFNRIVQFESYLRTPKLAEYGIEFATTRDLPDLRTPSPSSTSSPSSEPSELFSPSPFPTNLEQSNAIPSLTISPNPEVSLQPNPIDLSPSNRPSASTDINVTDTTVSDTTGPGVPILAIVLIAVAFVLIILVSLSCYLWHRYRTSKAFHPDDK